MKQNKFKIIIASYNNEEWVEYNLASVVNQSYKNYEVIYVDDNSTDNTAKLVELITLDYPNITLIKNDKNYGGTHNYIRFFKDLEDDDILLLLDGDDWLYDDSVLEHLNELYNTHDYWMTYGQFVVYTGDTSCEQSFPQGTNYSDFVHKYNLYRRDLWRASHLRTFKGSLVKCIDLNDMISSIDNKLYWHAGDLAFSYPCLEVCPEEKIGVVDRPLYVYNATPKAQTRTKERENTNNHQYEVEIRNKKSYKKNGNGEKLDQINLISGFAEYNTIPKKFTWCYDQIKGEYDITLIEDWTAKGVIEGTIKIDRTKPVVLRLAEHRSYFKGVLHNLIQQNWQIFDTILTHDKMLLETLPNAVFMPTTDCNWWNLLPTKQHPFHKPFKAHPSFETEELPDDIFQIYNKTKLVSVVASHKVDLPGHVSRLNTLNTVKEVVDVYGTCQEILFGKMINQQKKFEALKDYAFSIAIENLSSDIDDYYFSEKITDCFITGTIPIYRGCKNIGKFFDTSGILQFETDDELKAIINSLSMDLYQSMLPAVKANYELAMKTCITQDLAYDYYYKPIIDKHRVLVK